MNIVNTNEETGKENWTYTENRYNRGGPGSSFDYAAYNARELAKAQQTGGILKTNAESGLENWSWGNQPMQQAPPKDYFEQYQREQLGQAKKGAGGILKTNAESGAWNYASREYNDPNAIRRFNMEGQIQGDNTLPPNSINQFYDGNKNVKVEQKVENDGVVKTITTTTTTYNNNGNLKSSGPINSFSEIPKEVIERTTVEEAREVQPIKYNDSVFYNPKYNHPMIGEYTSTNYNPLRFGTGVPGTIKMVGQRDEIKNVKTTTQTFVTEKNFSSGDNMGNVYQSNSNNLENVGVKKIDTQENIVEEGGVRKKITKVTKYMDDGEIKTEIYKTTL